MIRGNGDGRDKESGGTRSDGQHDPASAPVALHEKVSEMATWDEIACEYALPGVAKLYDMSRTVLRKAIARLRANNERRAKKNGAGDAARGSAPDVPKILEEAAKPELVVETANLPAAADAVRDLFAAAGEYYGWGQPAKVVAEGEGGLPQIVHLSVKAVVNDVHHMRRPVELTPGGQRSERTLRDRVARLSSPRRGNGTCRGWRASPRHRSWSRTEAFERPRASIRKPGCTV